MISSLLLLFLIFPSLLADLRSVNSPPAVVWKPDILLNVDPISAVVGHRVARIIRPPSLQGIPVVFTLTSARLIPFAISKRRGVISVKEPLSKNVTAPYMGIISVAPSGSSSPQQEMTAKLTILSLPSTTSYMPDLMPDCELVKVMENNEPGIRLTRLELKEPPPIGIEVDFSVLTGRHVISVDRNTGTVYARQSFDREEGASWTVIVEAKLRKQPRSFSRCSMRIDIIDMNDNAPVFLGSRGPIFRVREDAKSGTYIGRLRATDKDAGISGTEGLTYSSATPGPFRLSLAGVLTLSGQLDREFRNEYLLTVVAKDKGRPRKSSTTTATILVDDVNDSPPKFVSCPKLVVTSCEENSPNVILAHVVATDPDSPEHNNIRYALWPAKRRKATAPVSRRHRLAMDAVHGLLQFQVLQPDLPCDHQRMHFMVRAYDPTRSDFKDERSLQLVMTRTKQEANAIRKALAVSPPSDNFETTTQPPETEEISPIFLLLAVCLIVPLAVCLLKLVAFFVVA